MNQEEPREAGSGSAETTPTETVQEPVSFRQESAPLGRGTSVGRYVILDAIGSGGMGVVYAGYDPELDRKVALKLLRPDRAGSEPARLRLLREAQAIARLSHPNVVTVHDAGTFGDRVFVAMEFVEGRTLRQWLAEAPRSWREIVDRFALAGRGLAAAHAAGLVHRDFKPDNVLLGEDGRVRVADFLATEHGVLLGTPAYMAPEQLRGQAADARSDQFGFCVSLYEALYGERPFAGSNARELAAAFESGEMRESPAGSRVPAWLRQVLLRGLSLVPEERHPSMDDLLRELVRDPAALRRRWLGAVAALVLIGGAVAAYEWRAGRQNMLCRGAEQKLAGVWDAAGKEKIRASFLATRLPFAPQAWKSVEQSLDRYTQSWARMHRDACEATQLRGEQSEELLDRRMFCLEQRLGEVRALTGLFSRADAQVVEKAVSLAGTIEPLDRCADTAALSARVAPPSDPVVRGKVEALSREISRGRALLGAGKFREGLDSFRRVPDQARQVAYRPVQAEASALLGELEMRAGELDPAERTLREAVWSAEAAAHDEVKARAAIELMNLLGVIRNRFEEAHQWEDFAAAAIDRLGKDDLLRAHFSNRLGLLYSAEGLYPEALAHHRKSVEIRRRTAGPVPDLAASIGDLGVTLYNLGRYPEALASFEEALSLQRAALGPEHPDVGSTLNRMGTVHLDQGHLEEGERLYRAALALRIVALGPDHLRVGDSYNNLGNALDLLARHDEAVASYRKSLEIRTQAFGPEHPDVAQTLDNLGGAYVNGGRPKEALQYHRQALELRLKLLGPDHPRVADSFHNVAYDYTVLNQGEPALRNLRQALAIEEEALGLDHPKVAEDLTAIADLERELGKPQKAIGLLERALRIQEKQEIEPGMVARTRFALARALWSAGGDRGRSLQLARDARQGFAGQDSPLIRSDAEALKEIEDWLAVHDRPGRGGT